MRADQILAWTLSFRKRLYCHSRRKFWESLRIDRIQMWYQYHRILHRTHQDFVNPSTFNVSDWYASSSWPSYCWSLISSTSYSSTSPKVPFWCMNPYDMPTRLVEIKEVDVELHLIILSTVDTDIGPFLFATTATHGPLSSYAPSSSFSSSCYHCYHYHRCHYNVAVNVNYTTTTLSLA